MKYSCKYIPSEKQIRNNRRIHESGYVDQNTQIRDLGRKGALVRVEVTERLIVGLHSGDLSDL